MVLEFPINSDLEFALFNKGGRSHQGWPTGGEELLIRQCTVKQTLLGFLRPGFWFLLILALQLQSYTTLGSYQPIHTLHFLYQMNTF